MKKIILAAVLLGSTSAFAMGIGNPADFPTDFPKDWPAKKKQSETTQNKAKKTLKAEKAKVKKQTIAAN
ncbi:MAG: hypothetical protein HRT44_03990 [Bdellovibrionales bacterium]|nr:hypothetical protein [Bdellovibrionales bacterium]NQZ18403.1 hypothetical protein [Bdellovibrionales bacterium]